LKNFVTGIFVATNKEFMELSPKLKAKAYVVGLGLEEIEPFDSQRQVSESFNFLYLGRITKKKRIDVALEAISKLRSLTTRNIHFNICGSGDEIITQEIKKRIAELSLNEIVSFHGWIAGRAKLEIIRNSDCFILTSEDENFAIAVAESLQCGVPTIISEQVALSQVVEEYGAGIIFKDLDSTAISCAMLKLMESNQATLRESARNASAQFNWKKVAINWHNSLLEVLNQ
jgi:glycosyltransferase involved in cell wall biosynthesis